MSRRGRAKALRLARDLAKTESKVPIVVLTREIVKVCETYRTGQRPVRSTQDQDFLDREGGFNRRRRRKDILKEGPPPDCKLGLESRTELSSFLLVTDLCGLKSTKNHPYGDYFSFIPKRKLPNFIRVPMIAIGNYGVCSPLDLHMVTKSLNKVKPIKTEMAPEKLSNTGLKDQTFDDDFMDTWKSAQENLEYSMSLYG